MAKNGKSRSRWVWFAGIVVLLICGAGFLLRGALKTEVKLDKSKLAQVERGDIARSVVATGKIQPRTKVEVKSKASGIVQKIYADYGQMVKAGQVLVELDKEDLQARLREAGAQLEAAEAAQLSAQAALERYKVEAEGPDVPFLKSAFDRAMMLRKQGLIAQNALEEAEHSYRAAVNKQASAQRAVSMAKPMRQKQKPRYRRREPLLSARRKICEMPL